MPSKSKDNRRDNFADADNYLEIAEKVRTGEYFREARSVYDLGVHDPMAERYMYVFITVLSLIILVITLKAMQELYPLNTSIPIIIAGEDNGEDVPHIQSILLHKKDDPDDVMARFLVKHFITSWEEYDISIFDRDAGTVKSQSDENLLKEYMAFIDPRNPESPITLYQRHSKRKIIILSTAESGGEMEVIFEAEVESRTDVKKSRWRANISFQFGGLDIDQNTGIAKPINFVVTKYHSKRLQDRQ